MTSYQLAQVLSFQDLHIRLADKKIRDVTKLSSTEVAVIMDIPTEHFSFLWSVN